MIWQWAGWRWLSLAICIASAAYVWWERQHPQRECRPVFVVMSDERFL